MSALSVGYNNHMCDLILMMSPIMVLFLSSWEIQFGIKSLTGSPFKNNNLSLSIKFIMVVVVVGVEC